MERFEINAASRTDTGKGANRRLRRNAQVPGILYGAGEDPAKIVMSHNELLLRLEDEAFYSHILTLNLDGSKQRVVIKDLQRHPAKPYLLHLDLQRVEESERLTMRVPIHFANESACVGVKLNGGVISHLMSELEIECLPKDLPEYIEVDVGGLDLGDTVHLGDLKVPDGVAIAVLASGGDPAQPVVSVHLPKVVEEEPEEALEAEAAADEDAAKPETEPETPADD